MTRQRLRPARLFQRLTVAASCVLCLALMGASRGSITKLTLDPDAPVVDLFDGLAKDQVEVRLVAQNAHEGKIFITNKTDKPLTVAIPKGLVGVPVLAQIGFNGGNNGNLFGQNQLNGQNGQNNGQTQAVGGNASPLGPNGGLNGNGAFPNAPNQFNNNFPNAIGFFSIPPEKTVQIGLNSVCLNYGRREPSAGMKYQLVKAETVTTDPVLIQLLEDYSPRTNREAQQAAAWNLANGLTWEQIGQLTDQKIPGSPTPLFSAAQLKGAKSLVEQAKKSAAERPKKVETISSVVSR